ncbi:MAG: R3H domain-containing nucleic acid-binding protein [Candidatus Azambacteria bacterium]|nr:R3H domain-containing nucleic acid-binding protein [Candidatus Azambacteria bacterium]
MTENLEKIKDITSEFFAKTGASSFEIKIIETDGEESLNICFLTDDPGSYIGERGRNIGVFETVLRLILKKRLSRALFFHLDVNNYRSLRDGSLKELAKKAAHKARFYKREVVLEPMTAYDRRIIHTELAIHPDIKTESIGEEEERRVVVKYIN